MGEGKKVKKILVVDDDPVLLRLLQGTLSEKGYDIKTADQAAEGLQYAIYEHPDLIILDVMMPIINGYNFCRLLKNEEKKKHIPIILLTSRDQLEDVEIGMEMGAEAYLRKPVNMEELFHTIKVIEGWGHKSHQPNK